MNLLIPEATLPLPRLIIWHGDTETAEQGSALEVISKAYHGYLGHHPEMTGRTAGGNDWTGWHLPDPGAVQGLREVANVIGGAHWVFEDEL